MSDLRVNKATTSFLNLVLPDEDHWSHPARPLVWSAFHLYDLNWRSHDIRKWVWPANQIRFAPKNTNPFKNAREQNAWTILLSAAMEMILAKRDG